MICMRLGILASLGGLGLLCLNSCTQDPIASAPTIVRDSGFRDAQTNPLDSGTQVQDSGVVEMDAMAIVPDASLPADTGPSGPQPGEFGATCALAPDCNSAVCLQSGHAEELGLVCSQTCTEQSNCPTGWYCRLKGERAEQCIFGRDTRRMLEKDTLTIVAQGLFREGEIQAGTVMANQLINGLQGEGWPVNTIQEALDRTDDGVRFFQITHAPSRDRYTHLKFYLGDTEVGYIYEEGSLNMVAVVGDGDINDCMAFEAVDVVIHPGSGPTTRYCFSY